MCFPIKILTNKKIKFVRKRKLKSYLNHSTKKVKFSIKFITGLKY